MASTVNWSVLLPPDVPREVAMARTKVEALRGRVGDQRRAIEAAKLAATEALNADERQMAHALSDGREPVSKLDTIEKAQALLAAEERKQRALEVAIGESEIALGEVVTKTRSKWARDAESGIDRAREAARGAIDELERAIGQMGAQMAIVDWLREGRGFDSGRSLGVIAFGARSSSRAAVNGVAYDVGQLLGWLREAVEPVAPARETPVEPETSTPVTSPEIATGALT